MFSSSTCQFWLDDEIYPTINTPHINELVNLLNLQCFNWRNNSIWIPELTLLALCSAELSSPSDCCNEHGRNVRNLSERSQLSHYRSQAAMVGPYCTIITTHIHTTRCYCHPIQIYLWQTNKYKFLFFGSNCEIYKMNG